MNLHSGPLLNQNLFVRNVQPHPDRNDRWIVEAQGGQKGKGKVWRPTLIAVNPSFTKDPTTWQDRHQFLDCGRVKPCQKSHRKGEFEVNIWWHPNYRWIEAYFHTEATAVDFMIHVGGRYAHVHV